MIGQMVLKKGRGMKQLLTFLLLISLTVAAQADTPNKTATPSPRKRCEKDEECKKIAENFTCQTRTDLICEKEKKGGQCTIKICLPYKAVEKFPGPTDCELPQLELEH